MGGGAEPEPSTAGIGGGEPGRRVAMALYGDLTFDSRVRREAATLARNGFDVTIACLESRGVGADLPANVRVVVREATATDVAPGSPSPFLDGRSRTRIGSIVARVRWLFAYVRNLRGWGKATVEAVGPVAAWHLHDLTALAAIAPWLPPSTPVVYDAHEIFLARGSSAELPGIARMLLRAYERRLVKRASALVTVNDAVAAVLARRYAPREVVVVHNCAPRWEQPLGRPTLIRDAARIPADHLVLLYHGLLERGRGIDQLLAALQQPGVEDVHLALLGFGDMKDAYSRRAHDPRFEGRVHVLDSVRPDELLPWVASADVGVLTIQRSTLNHYLSTPNKLFECIAAGVPVLASDFPAIRPIVENGPAGALGVVCDPADIAAIATAIREFRAMGESGREAYRRRALDAASARWNWQTESRPLVDLYRRLLGGT